MKNTTVYVAKVLTNVITASDIKEKDISSLKKTRKSKKPVACRCSVKYLFRKIS